MSPKLSAPLLAKLRRIRLFLCDVDGVLTDASVFIGGAAEMKQFNIHDGLGLRLLQRSGVKVGWISNRPSLTTELRAVELKVDFLHQGAGSKVAPAEQWLRQLKLDWKDVAFAGDDVVDLALMRRAGVAFAVANGIAETKAAADYTTRASGGQGAVRECVELILKAQGKWDTIIAEYSA